MPKKPKIRIPVPPPGRKHKDKSKYDRKAEKQEMKKQIQKDKTGSTKPQLGADKNSL
jgi:hypothetical protein